MDRCELSIETSNSKKAKRIHIKDHIEAVVKAIESLKTNGTIRSYNEIYAIGHRVVHGGEYYKHAVKIDRLVIDNIKKLSELAPLHNPHNLAGILACKKILPHTIQVAVFDTAFHQTIPKYAFLYGAPYEFYQKYGIRKYGFHGISHQYASEQASKLMGKKNFEMISCHLGNGSSITAIKDGKSIDTTMGFTPMDGLLMGTRSGGMDPNIPLYLLKNKYYSLEELEYILNNKSGLLGISREASDVRDLRKMILKGDKNAKLALEMLSYKISFYIGAYSTILGALDCLVFTGGIGENAYYIREKVLDSLKLLGVKYDKKKNEGNEVIISTEESKVKVFIIPANEELAIANEVYRLL